MAVNHSNFFAEAYPKLLDLMVRVVESQAGQEIPAGEGWRNASQTLAKKLFAHSVAISTLANPTRVQTSKGQTWVLIDHASVTVLARAVLETYLVWNYIFDSADLEQCQFRHLTWKLGGLCDRQKLVAVGEDVKSAQEEERKVVDELREKLRTHPLFLTCTDKQQRALLAGDWKVAMGNTEFALAAGFHGAYFRNVYGYLCGYSHASYVSALQVEQAQQSLEDQHELTSAMVQVCAVVLAHFICAYARVFPSAQAVLDVDPDSKALAEQLAIKAEDMVSVYGPTP